MRLVHSTIEKEVALPTRSAKSERQIRVEVLADRIILENNAKLKAKSKQANS